ncbi:hypothetical protein C8R43DRAFT_1039854 [Mycena crocata]|nr:hypothetical protein C8R43DRAFT_1039854 [Mycena crocata]
MCHSTCILRLVAAHVHSGVLIAFTSATLGGRRSRAFGISNRYWAGDSPLETASRTLRGRETCQAETSIIN